MVPGWERNMVTVPRSDLRGKAGRNPPDLDKRKTVKHSEDFYDQSPIHFNTFPNIQPPFFKSLNHWKGH